MEYGIEVGFAVAIFFCLFLLVVFWAIFGAVALIYGMLRIAENAELADRYRAMQAGEPPSTTIIDGWTLTYKSGRKICTVQVLGDSEADAVAEAMKLAIPFDKIVSIIKN